MPHKCFMPNCRSGLESVRKQCRRENRRHPQVFLAPKHWTMLQIWSHILPVSGKKFSVTDRVCELHFTEDYISKYHELTLDDGKIYKMERKYAKLMAGGIPTVFAEFPEYSIEIQKVVDEMREAFPLHVPEMDVPIDDHMESYFKRISELKKRLTSVSEEEASKDENGISIDDPDVHFDNGNETIFSDHDLDSDEQSMCDTDFDMYSKSYTDNYINFESEDTEDGGESEADDVTFDVLARNLKFVTRPSIAWSLTDHGIFIMCAKWNEEYQPEKRVVIDRDLNVKVFLNDNEIANYSNCISDVSDISNILRILDK